MRTKILRNPSKITRDDGSEFENQATIINYRIEEAKVGIDGEPTLDQDTGRYVWTGTTLEWTIKVGETVEFPVYVADLLLKIYPFLQEVKNEKEATVKRQGKKSGEHVCKYCQRSFKRAKDLGLHMGLKHTNEII